ncbi:MAG: enoyl-CoA hydratase/isomerase family protein [Chloroflexi bacterium]|nr:enoyl-CoA hydratase/isomerase family protein [Chloroflexota bacterium]
MSGFETLRYEKRDGVAVVTLCRPEAINAFNVRMRDELSEALSAARADADVRGLLIAGDGERGFCAGADLTEFGSAPSQAIARYVRWARDLWTALAELPKPTMAAVHGYCFGSGLEIAALCDLRIASQDAVFALPEASLGLIPAAGGTQSLPRIVGLPRAMEMALTGRRMSSGEAVRAGFVDWLVPREQLHRVAEARLRDVVSAPAEALALAKRAVNEGADMTLADGLRLERRLAARLR